MEIASTGLIYLSINELLCAPMTHLISGVDTGETDLVCGTKTSISGYTEWVSSSHPTISIGWDWYLDATPSGPVWSRVGYPSSNVMLLDVMQKTQPAHRNLEILGTIVDALPWRERIADLVAARYV